MPKSSHITSRTLLCKTKKLVSMSLKRPASRKLQKLSHLTSSSATAEIPRRCSLRLRSKTKQSGKSGTQHRSLQRQTWASITGSSVLLATLKGLPRIRKISPTMVTNLILTRKLSAKSLPMNFANLTCPLSTSTFHRARLRRASLRQNLRQMKWRRLSSGKRKLIKFSLASAASSQTSPLEASSSTTRQRIKAV